MEINTILNILNTYNLTADELLVIYLTFLARDEEGHPEFFHKWFENGGKDKLRNIFESLKEKGIIHKDYNTTTYNPNDIEFNKNFMKSWVKNSGQMGMEFFDAYPSWVYINGKQVMLRNVAKKFDSLEDFFFAYSSAIKHNPEEHKRVMELLQWGKDNDKIYYNICDFVISRSWNTLEELRNNPGQIASTFDVYETI